MDLPQIDGFQSFGVSLRTCILAPMGVLFAYSLLFSSAIRDLSLILTSTIMGNLYLWTLATAHLFETNLVRFGVAVVSVGALAPRVEARLGFVQSVQYTVSVCLACSFATLAWNLVGWVIFRREELLYSGTYGMGCLLSSLLMGAVANNPSRKVWGNAPAALRGPLADVQLRHVPLGLIAFSAACWLLGVPLLGGWCAQDLTFLLFGTFLAWGYLRYLAIGRDGVRGDFREEFKLVALFPAALRGPVEASGAFCFGIMILCGFFKDRLRHLRHIASTPRGAREGLIDVADVLSTPVLGLDLSAKGAAPRARREAAPRDPVAARRRERALKALDARLEALKDAEESLSDWSDMEEPMDDAEDADVDTLQV